MAIIINSSIATTSLFLRLQDCDTAKQVSDETGTEPLYSA